MLAINTNALGLYFGNCKFKTSSGRGGDSQGNPAGGLTSSAAVLRLAFFDVVFFLSVKFL